eukprot:TRINITY_DN55884_c0_g1_i1.p2 TRINITY_DN55884_c0_g1~~TRINITY_DN55884_c0_g1_i1.p2  ORF type:complete len:106 (+),score=7.26 TRINITY_DN55884_c0_g1_i1:841-1158(+)
MNDLLSTSSPGLHNTSFAFSCEFSKPINDVKQIMETEVILHAGIQCVHISGFCCCFSIQLLLLFTNHVLSIIPLPSPFSEHHISLSAIFKGRGTTGLIYHFVLVA